MYQNALNKCTGIYLPTFRVVAYLQGELNPGRAYIIASTLEVKNTISCSAAYYCSPALSIVQIGSKQQLILLTFL